MSTCSASLCLIIQIPYYESFISVNILPKKNQTLKYRLYFMKVHQENKVL